MWDYSATHSTLFLAGTSNNRVVEVSFTITFAFKLDCFMPSLLVREPHEHELSVLSTETGVPWDGPVMGNSRVFVVEAGERVGWVQAHEMLAFETSGTRHARDAWNRKVPADAVFVSHRGVTTWGERRKWAMPGFEDV